MSCCFEAPVIPAPVAEGQGQHWVNVTMVEPTVVVDGGQSSSPAPPSTTTLVPGFSLTFDGHYRFPPPIAVDAEGQPAPCRLTDPGPDAGGTSWTCTGRHVRFRVDTLPSLGIPGIAVLVSNRGTICEGKEFCPLLESNATGGNGTTTTPGNGGGGGGGEELLLGGNKIVVILSIVIVGVMLVGISYVLWRRNRKVPEGALVPVPGGGAQAAGITTKALGALEQGRAAPSPAAPAPPKRKLSFPMTIPSAPPLPPSPWAGRGRVTPARRPAAPLASAAIPTMLPRAAGAPMPHLSTAPLLLKPSRRQGPVTTPANGEEQPPKKTLTFQLDGVAATPTTSSPPRRASATLQVPPPPPPSIASSDDRPIRMQPRD